MRVIVAVFLWPAVTVIGQQTSPSSVDPQVVAPPTVQPSPEQAKTSEAGPRQKSYYVAPKGWGARNETEPPGYVKPLSEYKWMNLHSIDWVDFGIEHRTRWEYRDDNYRQADLTKDTEFLLRTRVYVGVREKLDPFRFAVEFQDSRQEQSDFPETDRDVNEADLLQAYAESLLQGCFRRRSPAPLSSRPDVL